MVNLCIEISIVSSRSARPKFNFNNTAKKYGFSLQIIFIWVLANQKSDFVDHHNVTFFIYKDIYMYEEDNLKRKSIFFAVLLNFLNKPLFLGWPIDYIGPVKNQLLSFGGF